LVEGKTVEEGLMGLRADDDAWDRSESWVLPHSR
jgi:hypothetical protein